jgi:hypothetical protein
MSIETLVKAIQESCAEYDLFNPPGASPEAVATVAAAFEREFQRSLPEAYRRLLIASDGILENGLTIWPCAPYWEFHESILTANRDLRENISSDFLYYGQRDDSVFVMELATGRYLAVELNGLAEWEEFQNCEAMIEFMLERALD